MNIIVNLKRHKKFTTLASVLLIFLPLFLLCLFPSFSLFYYHELNINAFNTITFGFENVVQCFCVIQFNLASLAVATRFRAFNTHLKKEILSKRLNVMLSRTFKASSHTEIFHRLCDGIEIINETYTFQLCFSFFLLTVSDNFNFARTLLNFIFLNL